MPRNKEFDYNEKLETVRNLFWKKGYNATSMHDIVATMNLNRSSIYDTYGNKHDLFLKCLSNYASFKERQYLEASKVKGKAIEALEYVIRDVVNQTLADDKACLIVNTIFEVAPADKEVKNLLQKSGNALQSILENLITQAKKDGDIKSQTSALVIARYILASFSSYWSHYILNQNKQEVLEMVDFLTEQIKR
ncbi:MULTISPECIES: TetR/AcrR family transcriptional regulator [Chryseobacterium group]|uniref:TetR family transcriptional regulator n=1 Tax=Kaistella haifensis DSM 19056 TaxID=1450526 RepID=A0A246B8B3_9FLAO|nr:MULTISPECIES: TetR/AcrR family transcriptional regulator [Chryseobacterium group]OWK97619.1 TetR family transcriptional regulator [Kaistella haifensis DSM 19056]VFA40731.1 Potential acrAB operon repressor [Chryseobacterium indologenes]